MNSKIIEKVQKIIDLRKYQAENEAIQNKIKALENKEFKDIFSLYMDKMLDEVKQGEKISKETILLKNNVDKKLKELNLFPIEPHYYCSKCNDMGIINGQYCDCFKKELNKILVKESGFNKLEDFDKISLDIFGKQKEQMKKLYEKMKDWCNSNFNKKLIILGGETGVGKTFLMKCMANELIKRNKVVTLTTSFAMNQDFLKSYATRDIEEKDTLLDKYLDSEILFIDDLGTELRKPGITVKYLYLILNERMINNRPTVITTNLKLEDINDYYDERVASRIGNKETSVCIYLTGEDLRRKNDIK